MWPCMPDTYKNHRLILNTLDFLCPIRTAEVPEAVDWLADLPQYNMAASRPVLDAGRVMSF